jgi:hypothetical protein
MHDSSGIQAGAFDDLRREGKFSKRDAHFE